MLYVTVGLALMFGVMAFLGLGAIQQATELVFRERLATAHTTASVLERDFERLAAHAREEAAEEAARPRPGVSGAATSAAALLDLLAESGPSPFFGVSGVWIVDAGARVLDSAGSPSAISAAVQALSARSGPVTAAGEWKVLAALGPVPGAQAFAALVVPLGALPGVPARTLVVHTVSKNSSAAYNPATLGQATSAGGPGTVGSAQAYHLEVVNPDGVAVLGVGEDERPGQKSPHAAAIAGIVREGRAAALLHEPGPDDRFEPHVMAVVPLPGSPFYVVLEQPVDVALALPLELRGRLLAWIAVGFLATLFVAWVTTRRVVKPTEQLTAAAERMALGDLGSPITVTAQDEIGALARSLDVMREHLREAQEAVVRTNRELETRVAERTARLGEVLRKTITAQEDERYRLARELHDETAQTLAALSIALDRARDELGGAPGASSQHIGQAKEIATRLLAETRRLILGLRPAALDDLGLVPALRWHCETQLAERGVATTIDDELGAARLPSHVEVSLFRILQEAVSNVARHADASRVTITLARSDGRVMLSVADDGRGFDVASVLGPDGRAGSVGLLGMQERVALLNGSMEVRSTEGAGTVVEVQVPLTEETGR